MRRVMAVEYGPWGRLRYVDAGTLDCRVGDQVLVASEAGHEVARCVWGPQELELAAELPQCVGLASADDLKRATEATERRAEIKSIAVEVIARRRLPMTVIAVDEPVHEADAGRVAVVYFRAPHRVDFRALIGDLARALQARVELRQVGPRDVAALVGGVGVCGREFCCCTLCPVAEPVAGRVSRDQEAANSALQLAGSCGRLKCCLAYEADAYADFAARAPRLGSVVATSAGEGVVSGHAMPSDSVWIRTEEGTRAVPLSVVTVVRPAPGDEPEPTTTPAAAPAQAPLPGPPPKRGFLRRTAPRDKRAR